MFDKLSPCLSVQWQKMAHLVLRRVGLCVGQNQMCHLCGWLKLFLKNVRWGKNKKHRVGPDSFRDRLTRCPFVISFLCLWSPVKMVYFFCLCHSFVCRVVVLIHLLPTVRRICEVPRRKFASVLGILHITKYTKVFFILKSLLNPNSAIEKKEYFSILISNCVAVEKNKR